MESMPNQLSNSRMLIKTRMMKQVVMKKRKIIVQTDKRTNINSFNLQINIMQEDTTQLINKLIMM